MEIGKFKLAKANLIRPPKKPTSEFLTREEAEIKSPGLLDKSSKSLFQTP